VTPEDVGTIVGMPVLLVAVVIETLSTAVPQLVSGRALP